MRKVLLIALLIVSLSAGLPSQTNWIERFSAHSPGLRTGIAMTYDSVRERIVLFGGVWGFAMRDTWEWDGIDWTQAFPVTKPAARTGHAMVYDSAREEIVLYGGLSFSDTWVRPSVTGNWEQRFPSSNPSPGNHAMAYDSGRQVVVLFDAQGETWEWDGADWLQRFPATVPQGIAGHTMAYDSERQVTVLQGDPFPGDLWEWDGTNWTQPPNSEAFLGTGNTMAYDSYRKRIVWSRGGSVIEWDGQSTFPRSSGSPAGAGPIAFDSTRRRVVLYSGSRSDAQTNEYYTQLPALITSFGAGCTGPTAIPSLESADNSFPWLNDTFTVELSSISTTSTPFIVLGFTRMLPPVDLSALGLPGCTQEVSLDFAQALVNNGGSATWDLSIPGNAAFATRNLYLQAAVLDSGATGGWVVSNALELEIGVK